MIIDTALPTETEGRQPLPTLPPRLYPSREAALARFRPSPPGGWPNPDVLAYLARHSVRKAFGGWTWKFDEGVATSLNDEPDTYREALYGVPVPTDVVYGERTEIMNPGRRAVAAAIAPACGPPVAVPCSHHHIMIEQPLVLAATLSALLAVPR